ALAAFEQGDYGAVINGNFALRHRVEAKPLLLHRQTIQLRIKIGSASVALYGEGQIAFLLHSTDKGMDASPHSDARCFDFRTHAACTDRGAGTAGNLHNIFGNLVYAL